MTNIKKATVCLHNFVLVFGLFFTVSVWKSEYRLFTVPTSVRGEDSHRAVKALALTFCTLLSDC